MTSPEYTLQFILAGQVLDYAYARQVPRHGDRVALHDVLYRIAGVVWVMGDHTNGLQSTVVNLAIEPLPRQPGGLDHYE